MLRTENQQLRAAGRQLQAAPKTGAAIPPSSTLTSQEGYYAKEDWAFTGYATPESALQSVVWTMREGDTGTFLASLTPEEIPSPDGHAPLVVSEDSGFSTQATSLSLQAVCNLFPR